MSLSFSEALAAQAAAHPSLQPQDAIKLCVQAACGAEHLLTDPDAAAAYLAREWDVTPPNGARPLCEPIGPGAARLDLAAAKAAGLPLVWAQRLFLHGAAPLEGVNPSLEDCLAAVGAAAAAGALPFSENDWREAENAWRSAGGGPVHHSEAYRAAEAPAYRVIHSRAARLVPLLARMADLPADAPKVVALDGRSASGKTTLADSLALVTGAALVHMDDFFLPPELRTPARFAQAGGNVHYERFAEEVLPHLAAPEGFSYRWFDCDTMTYAAAPRPVPAAPWRVVEGAYSCHPALGLYMGLRVFCDVAPDEQLRRIVRRNGETMARRFAEEWIPMEEAYFAACSVREKAQLVL